KYWDYLGWKDPFAIEENTARQRAYAQIHKDGLYTPQIVIDGAHITVGTDEDSIRNAIRFAQTSQPSLPLTLTPVPGAVRITLPASPPDAGVTLPMVATLWAMQYRKTSATAVSAGENRGKNLEGVHDVVRLTNLGTWMGDETSFNYPTTDLETDGVAFILQAEIFGRVVASATFND
ncbi:MAG: DUF1223 domain-containing protein, partial [Rickettsiales bacterium]|nr:DUF1223 domain-containing protein [Rickettsiales bacterium]